ncbi:MAG: hypothetical protein ABIB46_05360 [bacterium]
MPVLIAFPGLSGSGIQFISPRWAKFSEENGFVIISPSFQFNREDWEKRKSYQYPNIWSGNVLLKIIDEVGKKVKISKNELYLFGFSAGAQFAHRFALWKPEMCKAVAAHALGGVTLPEKWIPVKFLLTIGGKDIMDRKENVSRFTEACKNLNISVVFNEYPGIGHTLIEDQIEMSLKFFTEGRKSQKAKPNDKRTIEINFKTCLNGMSLKEIADFRIQKTKEYSFLGIFSPKYHPLKVPHDKIYRAISPCINWQDSAQFYISNPYLLIICSCANHVTPLMINCLNPKVEYSNKVIKEIYKGEDAVRWFEDLYSYPDYPGIVRIWMVNAYDAGLFYANVDISRSSNISPSIMPENIINSVYSNSGFFHKGRYGTNNLSPADPKGRIKLLKKDIYTCIYVKLWRERPKSKNQLEDFTYIVEVIP